jgi:hypothetical protein
LPHHAQVRGILQTPLSAPQRQQEKVGMIRSDCTGDSPEAKLTQLTNLMRFG